MFFGLKSACTNVRSDTPAIEGRGAGGTCNNLTGRGCFAKPRPANFYPIYTTAMAGGHCVWHIGGPNITGTTNDFGGRPTTAWGDQNPQPYIFPGGTVNLIETFRNDVGANPCKY